MRTFLKKYFQYILSILIFIGLSYFLFSYLTSFNYLAQSKASACSKLSHTMISNGAGGTFAVSHPWCTINKLGRLSLYNLLQPNKQTLKQSSFVIRSVNLDDYFKGPLYLVMDSETIANRVINQLLWENGFAENGSLIRLTSPQSNTAICGDIKINPSTPVVKIFLGAEEIPVRKTNNRYYFCTKVLNLEQLPKLNIAFSGLGDAESFVMKLYLPPKEEQGAIIPVTDFIYQHDYFVPFDLGQLTF